MTAVAERPTLGPSSILGREPVLTLTLVEAALAALLVFHVIDQGLYGALAAVAAAGVALASGWVTTERRLALLIGAFKAVALLFAVFGLSLTDEQTGGLVFLITAVFAFVNRAQTSPISPAGPPDPTYDIVGEPDVELPEDPHQGA